MPLFVVLATHPREIDPKADHQGERQPEPPEEAEHTEMVVSRLCQVNGPSYSRAHGHADPLAAQAPLSFADPC